MEQPLDAMLKALTPSTSELRFFADSTGHADGANAGFLRKDSKVLVILITDETDCSVPDENGDLLAGPSTGEFADTPVNMRCALYPDRLHPLERYAEGLTALRPDSPEDILFHAIVGIPVDLQGESSETVLNDPRMEIEPDGSGSAQRPRPSCVGGPGGAFESQFAQPPRRIVELAGLMGARASVQSICQESFDVPMSRIMSRVAKELDQAPLRCLD